MKTSSANVQEVELSDGRRVCLSYGVIVAAFIPRRCSCDFDCARQDPSSCVPCEGKMVGGYVRTDASFSVTTSRHMNQFAGKDAPRIPHAELLKLCEPLTSKQ